MLSTNNIIWKSLKENDHYEVSNDGQIRSKDRYVKNSAKTERFIKSKIKDQFIRSNTCQYRYVQLYKDDKPKSHAVHRLVAEAFIVNPDSKPQVNHKDGDKLNNHVSNLEWVTCQENLQHAWDTGLQSKEKMKLRMTGKKAGKTSKFRNVTYDKSKDRWLGCVKVNGKTICKRFPIKDYPNAEILAACAVNELIDEFGLIRPKNIIS